jgi:hypothetical protein
VLRWPQGQLSGTVGPFTPRIQIARILARWRKKSEESLLFSLYKLTKAPSGNQFTRLRETNFFGCNQGIVARHLRKTLTPEASEPYRWHFRMEEALRNLEPDAQSFVIELKPSQKNNASRFEVLQVWGYSENGWTPALLELRALLADEDSGEYPRDSFILPSERKLDRVYTFMYIRGSVRDGNLSDKWLPPGPGSTNSVLLWPEALEWFLDKITA